MFRVGTRPQSHGWAGLFRLGTSPVRWPGLRECSESEHCTPMCGQKPEQNGSRRSWPPAPIKCSESEHSARGFGVALGTYGY